MTGSAGRNGTSRFWNRPVTARPEQQRRAPKGLPAACREAILGGIISHRALLVQVELWDGWNAQKGRRGTKCLVTRGSIEASSVFRSSGSQVNACINITTKRNTGG